MVVGFFNDSIEIGGSEAVPFESRDRQVEGGGLQGVKELLDELLDFREAGFVDCVLGDGGEGLVGEGTAKELVGKRARELGGVGSGRGAGGGGRAEGGAGAEDENGLGFADLGEEKTGDLQVDTSVGGRCVRAVEERWLVVGRE